MSLQSAFTLNPNEIFGSIANMIISQEVFADNLGKHQTLVDKARVDGSLFGDKKLFYAADVLATHPWGADTEATNLLALDRPSDPEVQDITLDIFRQIRLTTDNYLSKRAWSNEGAFSSFNSVMLGWMRETKKVYDGTHYNVFIGTTVAEGDGQNPTAWTLTNGKRGQDIAEKLANLIVEMGDYSRDFNDYGFLRSYSEDQVKVIWNSKYVNEIKKVDTPTIYHREGLVDKLDEDVMPSRYFGRAIVADDCGSGKVIKVNGEIDATKGTVRSKVEKEFVFGDDTIHVFPGDKLASGVKVSYEGGTVSDPDFDEDEVYIEDAKVICKIVVKLPPYMSAFEVGTSFFNPRSLTENHYLTFGHNSIEYLKNYPFITIKEA